MPFFHVPTSLHRTTRTHKRFEPSLPLPAILGLFVTLAVAPTSVLSQQPVEVGDRVRVRLAGRPNPLEGIFQGREDGSLILARVGVEDAFTVPLASVRRMEVHRGKKSHRILGARIGLLAGVLVGAWIAANDRDCTRESIAAICGLLGAFFGGNAGLLVGAGVGLIVRTDRWEITPLDALPASRTALQKPRLRLGVSIPIGGDANRRGGRYGKFGRVWTQGRAPFASGTN